MPATGKGCCTPRDESPLYWGILRSSRQPFEERDKAWQTPTSP